MKTITHLMIVILSIVAFGLGAALAAEVEIPNNFQAGTPAVAAEVNENFTAIENAILSIASNYTEFGSLNNDYVTVGTSWIELNTGGPHSFTKEHDGTKIEVYVNARFKVEEFSGDPGRVIELSFQARIDDDIVYDFGNDGSIITPQIPDGSIINTENAYEFLSIFNVFLNLPAGDHTVTLWAQTDEGTASNVLVDPYNAGGKIIVKETW